VSEWLRIVFKAEHKDVPCVGSNPEDRWPFPEYSSTRSTAPGVTTGTSSVPDIICKPEHKIPPSKYASFTGVDSFSF